MVCYSFKDVNIFFGKNAVLCVVFLKEAVLYVVMYVFDLLLFHKQVNF